MSRTLVLPVKPAVPVKTPPLVIVTGAPGSGKSLLARRLAADLRLPLIAKDELKERLYDVLPPAGAAANARLGQAAYAVFYTIASRLLDAGTGLILESNFYPIYSEAEVRPIVARACAVQIHCGGDAEVIIRRYQERAERGERHPGHLDAAALPRLRTYLSDGHTEPMSLGVPTLRVDTTTGEDFKVPLSLAATAHSAVDGAANGAGVQPIYVPDYDAILSFVRAGIPNLT